MDLRRHGPHRMPLALWHAPPLLLILTATHALAMQIEVIDDDGAHVPDAAIYLVSANATKVEGLTRKSGFAYLTPTDGQAVTLLCAAANHRGYIAKGVDPTRELRIVLHPQRGGSVLFANGSGALPGLTGTLNPILDAQGRTYTYGRDLAIAGGAQQPVYFTIGTPFRVEDAKRVSTQVTVSCVIGRIFLIDYTQPAK